LKPHGVTDIGFVEVELVDEEIVGVLGLDSEGIERIRRKIFDVVRDDHSGPGLDRGGKDMAVIGIRQLKTGNQVAVSRDETVAHVRVHHVARALQLLGLQMTLKLVTA